MKEIPGEKTGRRLSPQKRCLRIGEKGKGSTIFHKEGKPERRKSLSYLCTRFPSFLRGRTKKKAHETVFEHVESKRKLELSSWRKSIQFYEGWEDLWKKPHA